MAYFRTLLLPVGLRSEQSGMGTVLHRPYCVAYAGCSGVYMDNFWLTNADELLGALNHLRLALASLDAAGAPAHIGAHVDLAVNQLQDALTARTINWESQIDTNAEPQ